jgi:hypothetical protein
MTELGTRAVAAAGRLREALEQTATALASPRLETLLAGETAIESALSSMPTLDELPADERLVVRRELERARGALLRCRRLGTSLRDYIRLSFEAQGRGGGYGPRSGDEGPRQSTPSTYAGQAINARV